jgi:nuclear transcription factor Y alpha
MDAKELSKGDGEGSEDASPPKSLEVTSAKRKSESGPSTSSKKPKTATDGAEGNQEDDS